MDETTHIDASRGGEIWSFILMERSLLGGVAYCLHGLGGGNSTSTDQ